MLAPPYVDPLLLASMTRVFVGALHATYRKIGMLFLAQSYNAISYEIRPI